jgi:hypothetical protein
VNFPVTEQRVPLHDAPAVAHVVRSGFVESVHRGSVVVVDANGSTLLAVGDIAGPMFPRSSSKPIQAFPTAFARGSNTSRREFRFRSNADLRKHWWAPVGLEPTTYGLHEPSNGAVNLELP